MLGERDYFGERILIGATGIQRIRRLWSDEKCATSWRLAVVALVSRCNEF